VDRLAFAAYRSYCLSLLLLIRDQRGSLRITGD
jgi:hypothetical protein